MKDDNFLKELVRISNNNAKDVKYVLTEFGHLLKSLALGYMDDEEAKTIISLLKNENDAFNTSELLTFLGKNTGKTSNAIFYNLHYILEAIYCNVKYGADVKSIEKTILSEYGESSQSYISFFMNGNTTIVGADFDNDLDPNNNTSNTIATRPFGSKPKEEGDKDDFIPLTTFDDVAGIDSVKAELMEVVDFLMNPEKYNKLGAKIPKGVLLTGLPGVGKTLLAKAVAGEAGVAFIDKSGADFETGLVGGGANNVREMFEEARAYGTCILFIDEIDALAKRRSIDPLSGKGDDTLNQFLVEFDGYGTEHDNIIVIGATNLKDKLDPAVLRPGRFDRVINVDVPDIKGREEILKVHARNKPLDRDVDLAKIAQKTIGMTGADLANLLNESAILGARGNAEAITMNDIEVASEKVMMGLPKEKTVTEEERLLVATHEVGHGLSLYLLPTDSKLHSITIVPRGGALGYARSVRTTEKGYKTKKEYLDDIKVSLAGVVAEELFIGEVTSGCSSDLKKANAIAKAMIGSYGMNGSLIITEKPSQKQISTLLTSCYNDVKRMLESNSDDFMLIVKELLKKETLCANDIEELIGKGQTEKSSYSDKINTLKLKLGI